MVDTKYILMLLDKFMEGLDVGKFIEMDGDR